MSPFLLLRMGTPPAPLPADPAQTVPHAGEDRRGERGARVTETSCVHSPAAGAALREVVLKADREWMEPD